MSIDLYHFPPSFYSQIARFALHEAGLEYRDRLVVNVSPFFDHYHPEFVRLNPEMTVPASRFEGEAVNGSMNIARRAGEAGQALVPAAHEQLVEKWVSRYEALPLGALTVGAFQKLDPGIAQAGHKRAAHLEAKLSGKVDVELRKYYERKLESVRADNDRDADPSNYEDAKSEYGAAFDELEAHLEDGREFIAGSEFSLADIVWSVTVARTIWLQEQPFDGRPSLEGWYGRVKSRPAFAAAKIWEKKESGQALGMLARRLSPVLSTVAVLVGAIVLFLAIS